MITIDIISGFLGAGKTTFSNLLLKYYLDNNERPVFIVNEFGETGIDASITKQNGFMSIEMANGCICCTLKNNIARAITEIIKSFSPTKIVFEPSGVFIFDSFFDILKDEFLKENCEIGSVITIVDSLNFKRLPLIKGNFIYNQIRNSPQLIISKLERFSGDVSEILLDIRNINPESRILAKKWNSFTDEDFKNILMPNINLNLEIESNNGHEKVVTKTILAKKIFDDKLLAKFITNLNSGLFGEIYRVKGLINKDNEIMLLNVAFEDIELKPSKLSDDCSLTFIGKTIKEDKIKEILGY